MEIISLTKEVIYNFICKFEGELYSLIGEPLVDTYQNDTIFVVFTDMSQVEINNIHRKVLGESTPHELATQVYIIHKLL